MHFLMCCITVVTEIIIVGIQQTQQYWGCPRGVMVKAMDCGIVIKRDRTPVARLRTLSGKYPWERYEPPYPPSYGLNSITTVLLGE